MPTTAMKTLRLLAVMAAVALMATGCRSTRVATTPTPPTAATEYTVITFDATVDGVTVNGQVRMAKDSLIWCNATKIIELGRGMATPDSVWVRIPLMGRYETGDYNRVKQLTGLKTSFAELQEILESDDIEARMEGLARRLGHTAKVKLKRRTRAEKLTFPFTKE